MLLKGTTEQIARIEEILRQLDSTQVEAQPNRRRLARFAIRTTILALVLGHGSHLPIKVFSRNISTSGIGFVCRRFCRAGELLALSFRLPGHTPKLVLAQVTFSRYVRGGLYEAGAEFLECSEGTEERNIPLTWLHRNVQATTPAKPQPGKPPAKIEVALRTPIAASETPLATQR